MSIRKYLVEYALAVFISIVVLIVALTAMAFIPIHISNPFMGILSWPLENLMANKESQRELTIAVFGRMTPNYAPIQLVLYFVFWPIFLFLQIRIIKYTKTCLTS